MSDPDFNSGVEQGKRAVQRTAGWVTGVGSSILSPLAKTVASAAEVAQRNRERKRQREEVRRVAFEQRTASLQEQLTRERERREPFRLRYVLLMFVLGAVFALGALQSIAPSPDRWKGVVALFAVGLGFGAIVGILARGRHVRRAQRELQRHVNSSR